MSDFTQPTAPSGDTSNVEADKEQQNIEEREVTPETVESSYFANAAESRPPERKLPDWLDHFNSKDLKKLFKASVAVWILTVFILIDPTLQVIGQAPFLGWYVFVSCSKYMNLTQV
jgi:hypothetical protein